MTSRTSPGRLATLGIVALVVVAGVMPVADALGGPALHERLPSWLRTPGVGDVAPWQWIGLVLVALFAVAVGAVVARALVPLLREAVEHVPGGDGGALHDALRAPVRAVVSLLVFAEVCWALHLARGPGTDLGEVHRSLVVVAVAWLAMRGVSLFAVAVEARAAANGAATERATRTRARLVRRIAHVFVAVLAAALVLLQFGAVRSAGISLLASAGVAGLVLGFAAQRSLGTLLAGIQVAIAEPLRVGDQIVLDGEFGTVEDVTLTMALVRTWDDRLLVVPISRFLEKAFENWTRKGSALTGSVELRCDYAVPVPRVREELVRFVASREEWNRRTVVLQMTAVDELAVTLRALVSADDATRLFALRCAVREHLVAHVAEIDGGIFLPYPRGAVATKPV